MFNPIFNNPIISIVIVVFSVMIHEIAHGFAAERLGDPTARLSGRLTLNPLSHLDPMMSIFLPLLLMISGSPVVLGAAKPVPIDPYNFRDPKKDMGLVGIAGPLTNFLLAIFGAVIFRLIIISGGFTSNLLLTMVAGTALSIIQINLALFVFNLIPIPPLDGSRILTAFLDNEQAYSLQKIEPFGFLIIFFLLLFPLPFFPLSSIIGNIIYFLFRLLIGTPTFGMV